MSHFKYLLLYPWIKTYLGPFQVHTKSKVTKWCLFNKLLKTANTVDILFTIHILDDKKRFIKAFSSNVEMSKKVKNSTRGIIACLSKINDTKIVSFPIHYHIYTYLLRLIR